MIGPNRSGKTVFNAASAIEHAYGYRIHEVPDLTLTPEGDYPPRSSIDPKYWIRRPDGVPLRQPTQILLCTGLSLPKGIGKILWPELQAWLPGALRGRLKTVKGPQGVVMEVSHPDDLWTIWFGSIQQATMEFEGTKYDAVGFDEPPTRPHFQAIWRGMTDYYAPFWMTFTPIGHNAPWLYEEFVAGERTDTHVVQVDEGQNVHLPQEAWEEFIKGLAGMSEEDIRARREGRFGFLTHMAFPTFDESVHVTPDFHIPPEWPRVLACDPANRRPFYFVWMAYDVKRRTWIAYREWPRAALHHTYRSSSNTVQDYATMIRNQEGDERVDARVIDPRFGPAEYTVKGQKLTSVVDDFSRFGLHFDARVPDTGRIETGINRVRELLWYDPHEPLTESNRPHLLITPECPSLIHALKNYAFVPPNQRDERVLPEQTAEAFKDPIDALRYGILYGPPAVISRAPTSYIADRDWEEANAIPFDWL